MEQEGQAHFEIKSLEDCLKVDIVDCLHLAFSDYMIPMKASVEYWKNRWMAGGIQYHLSFGCFNKNELVFM